MFKGLTEGQCRAIDQLLLELLVRSESEGVFLCNRGGYILAESLVEEYEQNDNIAALSAGSFFATREIARMVGEPEFRSVLHQGECKGIYMQSSHSDMLIVIVFGMETNPGLVKFCAEEMILQLDKCFASMAEDVEGKAEMDAFEFEINADADMFSPV